MKLSEVCALLNVPGKAEGMDGGKVAEAVDEGRIEEVAAYCAQDVVATYRVFLAYNLFATGLSEECFFASIDHLQDVLLGLHTLPKYTDIVADERAAAAARSNPSSRDAARPRLAQQQYQAARRQSPALWLAQDAR